MYKIKTEEETYTLQEYSDWVDDIGLIKVIQRLIKTDIGPFRGSIEIKWKDNPERNTLLEIDYVKI